MFNVSIMCIAKKKVKVCPPVEFSASFLNNGSMKTLWFLPLVLALLLSGCSPDRTLESLVPRNALAVVLVDHPGLVAAALGSAAEVLPLKALDTEKPWAVVVVPSNPPGFFLALALAQKPDAWPTLQNWAQSRGGLTAAKAGTYGVFYSPGMSAPGFLEVHQRFNLARVRAGGDPLAVYVDAQNVLAESGLTAWQASAQPALLWAQKNLAGARLGLAPHQGGLKAKLTLEWKPGSPAGGWLSQWPAPADLSLWTGLLPSENGIGAAVSLPASAVSSLGELIQEPALRQKWATVAPLLGPRVAAVAVPRADGTWSWAAAAESRDPQGVRQALKTLVAGGEFQRSFPAWAFDGDTPLIYQDQPDGFGGVIARVSLGPNVIHLGYGADKVTASGGAGAVEALRVWQREAKAPAPWFQDAPAGSSLVAQGSINGLGALGSVRILPEGDLEATVWVDGPGLRAWEERWPQMLPAWAGAADWFRKIP